MNKVKGLYSETAIHAAQAREDARAREEKRKPRLIARMDDILDVDPYGKPERKEVWRSHPEVGFDFAIERVRHIGTMFGWFNETFNTSLTLIELLALHEYCSCSWAAYENLHECADTWTADQVKNGIRLAMPRVEAMLKERSKR